MKTSRLVLASFLVAASAAAQGATVITSAPTIEAAINTSSTDLNATLTQLLEEAEMQNEKLQTSLDRMGDPSTVNLASVQIIKQDILDSASILKTEEEQRSMMTALTGAEVFEDDAFGVMEPIGSTITREDGEVVQRDPEKYRMESAMMAQVKEFKEVREKALERKKLLTEELSAVLQEMEDATDLSSIQKLDAMLAALRGQIEECNQTILIAQADAEMTQKELLNQAQIITKGKYEEAEKRYQTGDPDAPAAPPEYVPRPFGGVAEGGTAARLIPNLTWGPRGTGGTSGGDTDETEDVE